MKIQTASSGGYIEVTPEDKGSSADVYVRTPDHGASLKLADVRELIEGLAKEAGFRTVPTGSGMGIIIQFPESPAVQERRDDLAQQFYSAPFEDCTPELKYAIEFIIEGEKQRGELR